MVFSLLSFFDFMFGPFKIDAPGGLLGVKLGYHIFVELASIAMLISVVGIIVSYPGPYPDMIKNSEFYSGARFLQRGNNQSWADGENLPNCPVYIKAAHEAMSWYVGGSIFATVLAQIVFGLFLLFLISLFAFITNAELECAWHKTGWRSIRSDNPHRVVPGD